MRAMRLSPCLFHCHRWLSWLVGVQVLVWSLSGLLFAWLPFQPWVKGQDVATAPPLSWPANWRDALQQLPEPRQLQAVMTPHGAVLKLGDARWQRLDGRPWRTPDAAQVQAFAAGIYRGGGRLIDVQRLAELPRQLGIVAELGERRDVWRVRFDDALQTRLYFDGASGEYLTVRTRAWVWYDFFWRLHIMDYAGGEDFNGGLLRGAALGFFGLCAAGLGLSALALRRAARRNLRMER